MSTYAEYSQQMMASDNDFELYPFQSTWSGQTYLPASFANQSFTDPTSFDSFPSQQSYVQPSPQPFAVTNESFLQSKNYIRPQSPNCSPSNSAANSFDYQNLPVLSSISDSGASVQSTISSAMGSPSAHHQASNDWTNENNNINMLPNIVLHDSVARDVFATTSFDLETIPVTDKGCVDPSLIQPLSPQHYSGSQYPDLYAVHVQQNLPYPQAPSPVLSSGAIHSPRTATGKAPSPYVQAQSWQPYPAHPGSRRQSVSSVHSRHSQVSLSSDDSNKGLCLIHTCGRHVKDLKAHMLTHQNERPEKCPIPTCEYHTKGFARKYDKSRHTLTHYKGTMVCGFCPGSGSAAEKSFNRADVFKRHLTSVHGVEQTPPNARRKSPSAGTSKKAFGAPEASGMCSTCGVIFASAQDLYIHLDECVLRVVQQAEPSEAINEKLLSSVAEDEEVRETLEKHSLPTTIEIDAPTSIDGEEDAEDDDEAAEDDANDGTYGNRSAKSGKGALRTRKAAIYSSENTSMHSGGLPAQQMGGGDHVSSHGAVGKPNGQRRGLTHSKNGVPLAGAMNGKGSKRRKNYPLSWGAPTERMRMKKRVLCVYDGSRRLWKDDMMLDADHEVRIPLPGMGDGRAWVTDLDIQTLNRAEALHNATEEEKGVWDEDLDQFLQ
ncbi:hypothetical protein LTR08_003878 [Meristemomyces frigidus]|nr:hypothetical protein LTR08_003878 [Meristemomyces frigidus]